MKILKRAFQLQKYLLRWRGFSVGGGNTFNGILIVRGPKGNLIVGDRNVFNSFVYIDCTSKVTIGNECHFSRSSKIVTNSLTADLSSHVSSPITICDKVWLAVNSIVVSGRTETVLSKSVTLAAGSVLINSALQSGLYAGVPATLKQTRKLNN